MMGRRGCFPCRTAVTDNRARAKIYKRLAGCSGSPAAIGQPLRPVTLRPPSFAGGSPCQNTLMPGIIADGMARLRHRDYVDHVTEYLNATATCGDIRQTCRSLLIGGCRHLAGFRPLVSSKSSGCPQRAECDPENWKFRVAPPEVASTGILDRISQKKKDGILLITSY
jgi:hypothetical protein